MSTDLFQALTLGLLVIVILALLVAVSMLGKVRAALERRTQPEEASTTPPAETPAEAVPASVDEAVAEVTGTEPSSSGDEPGSVGVSDELKPAGATEAQGGDAEEDSERPFERAGRWYFRRGGELLVYEEGTGEWVPAAPAESGADAGVQHQAQAVEASTEPSVAEVAEEQPVAVSSEPSTSFAGQPLAAAEEQVATLGTEAVGDEGAVATGFEEPGGGAVDLDEAATVDEEPPARAGDSFWKCESCGAINGSTATSCRMCFTTRP